MKSLKIIAPLASIACALHCALMPLLIIIFPLFSVSLLITESLDWLLLILSFFFNLLNLCFGFKKHKSLKAFTFLGTGFGLLLIGKLQHAHQHVGSGFDIYDIILIIGAVFILLSSAINGYLCKTCKVCHTHCSHEK